MIQPDLLPFPTPKSEVDLRFYIFEDILVA